MEMQPKESELPPPPEYSGPGYPAAQPLYPPAQSQYPPGLAVSVISGYETCNRYEVKNPLGQWLYFAAEENDDFTLNMYGALRPFTIKLFNSTNQPVIQLSRSFQCSICCCPCVCCLQ
ncbi:Phospholipid scramblase 1, partial [Varanus komodoensis]